MYIALVIACVGIMVYNYGIPYITLSLVCVSWSLMTISLWFKVLACFTAHPRCLFSTNSSFVVGKQNKHESSDTCTCKSNKIILPPPPHFTPQYNNSEMVRQNFNYFLPVFKSKCNRAKHQIPHHFIILIIKIGSQCSLQVATLV